MYRQLIFLVMGVLRIGRLLNFVSHSVMVGFTSVCVTRSEIELVDSFVSVNTVDY